MDGIVSDTVRCFKQFINKLTNFFMKIKGLNYTFDGNEQRRSLRRYHGCPRVRNLKKGSSRDIKGIPQNKKHFISNCRTMSKYSIGMEVEKHKIHESIFSHNSALIQGIEQDSSCGTPEQIGGHELVTNIIPLLPNCAWKTKIIAEFYNIRKAFDDDFSPSGKSCGGHITLGSEEINSEVLWAEIRKYMGLIYALYRFRLKNYYCRRNSRLNIDSSRIKYAPMVKKSYGVEIRLFSRFRSINDAIDRYNILAEMINSIEMGASFEKFLSNCEKTLYKMYETEEKVSEIKNLARSFQKFIEYGDRNSNIEPFLYE